MMLCSRPHLALGFDLCSFCSRPSIVVGRIMYGGAEHVGCNMRKSYVKSLMLLVIVINARLSFGARLTCGKVARHGKVNVHNPLEYSLTFDSLIGKTMAFKVKWQPKWSTSFVISTYQDEKIVKQLLGRMEENKIKESVDEAIIGDDCDFITDLKITLKHNPELVTPLASEKRVDHHSSNESTNLKE
ncbi:hypothetical protein KIW84_062662 [Lathyrus oleraceus]|uniref:Uncharacterized protein n=1 Tax=Pisum sativum TaxID=3888 RepID=A0A9D4W9E6_PEA|nr:hypothetical protein KIW84_062662 [Pisum sativum]